jgi:hypothetical protein
MAGSSTSGIFVAEIIIHRLLSTMHPLMLIVGLLTLFSTSPKTCSRFVPKHHFHLKNDTWGMNLASSNMALIRAHFLHKIYSISSEPLR